MKITGKIDVKNAGIHIPESVPLKINEEVVGFCKFDPSGTFTSDVPDWCVSEFEVSRIFSFGGSFTHGGIDEITVESIDLMQLPKKRKRR